MRKAASLFMCLVLSMSMMSTTALTAFGDQLQPAVQVVSQVADNPLVYDSVYGVFGNYAVMEKYVEKGETLSDGTQNERGFSICDVVDARTGEVTLHTSSASGSGSTLGEQTDYESFMSEAGSGVVVIQSKVSRKYGAWKLDGSVLLPCKYDSITRGDNEYLLCATTGQSSVQLEFYGIDGSSLGEFAVDCPSEGSYFQRRFYGDYARAGDAVFYKGTSGFTRVDGAVDVLRTDSHGNALLADADGFAAYCAKGGSIVRLAKYGDYNDYTLRGSFAWFRKGTGSSNSEYTVYNALGKRLDLGTLQTDNVTWRGVDSGFDVMTNAVMVRSGDEYALYDANGNLVQRITSGTVNVPKRYDTGWIDASSYYTVYTENGTEKTFDVYRENGSLLKRLGSGSGIARSLGTLEVPDSLGKEASVGYKWGESYYTFDMEPATFEQLTTDSLKLLDGTLVRVDYYYSSMDVSKYQLSNSSRIPISKNGYTLGVATDNGLKGYWNAAKHGNADVWWAYDSEGKWGAIDSYGSVKVPFEYESYFDRGDTGTDYALVKKDGVWRFCNVATGAETFVKAATAGIDLTGALVTAYDLRYTGRAIVPAVHVAFANLVSVPQSAYTVVSGGEVDVGTATYTVTGRPDAGLSGEVKGTFRIVPQPLDSATVSLSATKFVYNGSVQKPTVASVKVAGRLLREGDDYVVSYSNENSRDVGNGVYSVTVEGLRNYSGKASASYSIVAASPGKSASGGSGASGATTSASAPTSASALSSAGTASSIATKSSNPMKVKLAKKILSVKAKKLKRKAQSVKPLKVTGAAGKVTFKNVSTKKALKKFKVAAKTGKVTVPKNTKKGTYKVRVRVSAAGDPAHQPATKTVTCTIKVK